MTLLDAMKSALKGRSQPKAPVRSANRTAGNRLRWTNPVERSWRTASELAAVNGVVIPSKIPPGGTPNHGPWVFKAVNPHPCSICGMKFGRKSWVKKHMPHCVELNGNPNGAHWDDGWKYNGINYGGPDSESEDDEIPNPQPYGLPLDMLANETFSEVASYDRPLRVDVLDNFALLEMIEGWQKIARQVGNDYVLAHPQCQAVLKEMYVRGMVNTAGIWLVDPDQVDMKFVRVTRS